MPAPIGARRLQLQWRALSADLVPRESSTARSADRVQQCLMFGVDRTYRGHQETDAFDAKRTWQTRSLDHQVGASANMD